MAWRGEVADICQDVGGLNDTLIDVMVRVAGDPNMIRESVSSTRDSNKPWFDKEYKVAKQQLRSIL